MTGQNGESLDNYLAGETYRAQSREFSKNIVHNNFRKTVFCEFLGLVSCKGTDKTRLYCESLDNFEALRLTHDVLLRVLKIMIHNIAMEYNESSTVTHSRHGDLITNSFVNKCSSTAQLCYQNPLDIMEVLRGVAGSIDKTDSQRDNMIS